MQPRAGRVGRTRDRGRHHQPPRGRPRDREPRCPRGKAPATRRNCLAPDRFPANLNIFRT